VKPQLKVLTGFSAGAVIVQGKPYIAIGRHPASDLRFDPDNELDVSARHAAILQEGGRWIVRDLGSRNGTLVNGHKISGEVKLDDTDQLQFGPQGPKVEFRLVADSAPDQAMPPVPQGQPAAPRPSVERAPGAAGAPRATSARGSTTQRIQAEVKRQTKALRGLTLALFAVLAVVVGAFVWQNRRQETLRAQQARAMQARIDSVLATSEAAVRSLKGQVAGLADALRRSQTEVKQLSNQLASARAAGNAQQVQTLSAQLDDATETLHNQQVAAQVNYSALYEANQRAVGIIYVDFGPDGVFTGTAFAVTRDGVMITNRHVVAGADGTRHARRIGVKFADSNQNFPARLLAVSTDKDADVAVVKVDIAGGNPAVQPLDPNATVRPGDPVAIIGFPLGVDLPTDVRGGRAVARTSLTAGTVSKVLSTLVQVDGYGAEGSSGSPIFDEDGNVVAVLYGGQPGTGGRIVFGVPIAYAARLAAPFIHQDQN
jgi:S1-C subfamily serine protease/pSer/pThr/pTyr-binding forkhead associated (FHA) protein